MTNREKFLAELNSFMRDFYPTALLSNCNCELVEVTLGGSLIKIMYKWIPSGNTGYVMFNLDMFPHSESSLKDIADKSFRAIKWAILSGELSK